MVRYRSGSHDVFVAVREEWGDTYAYVMMSMYALTVFF